MAKGPTATDEGGDGNDGGMDKGVGSEDGGIIDGNGIGPSRKRPRHADTEGDERLDGAEAPPPPENRRSSANTRMIKLLLHGEGGSPPYLTPRLLARCFPPSPTPGDGGDTCDDDEDEDELTTRRRRVLTGHLIFGIEIRDSCVVPVYPASPDTDTDTVDDGGTKRDEVAVVGVAEEEPSAVTIEGDVKSSGRRGRRRAGSGGSTNRGRVVVDPTKPTGFEFGVRRGLTPGAALRHLGIPPGYDTMVLPAYDAVDSYVQSSNSSVGGKGAMPMQRRQKTQPKCTANEMVLPTPHGHQRLGCPNQFLECVDGLGVTTAVAPYDQQEEYEQDGDGGGDGGVGDEPSSKSATAAAGARRVERSVERTSQWLDRLLEREGDDGVAAVSSRPRLWGAVVGGCGITTRRESARSVVAKHASTSEKRLCGAALIGMHRIRDRRRRLEVMEACLEELRSGGGLKTVVPSTGGILEVVDAGLAGVDVIGSDLPTRLARRGMALVLDVRGRRRGKGEGRDGGVEDTAIDGDGIPDREDSSAGEKTSPSPCYCIDLKDPMHARDGSPLQDGCDCFSCRPSPRDDPKSYSPDGGGGGNRHHRRGGHYTRAYVHHLLNVGELLAEILLFVHNMHQLLLLFEEMSSVVRGGVADDVDWFRSHVESPVVAVASPDGRDAVVPGAGDPS